MNSNAGIMTLALRGVKLRKNLYGLGACDAKASFKNNRYFLWHLV